MNRENFCIVNGLKIPYQPLPGFNCDAARYVFACRGCANQQEARDYEQELARKERCVIIHIGHRKIKKIIGFPDNTLAIFDVTIAPRIIIAFAPEPLHFKTLIKKIREKKAIFQFNRKTLH